MNIVITDSKNTDFILYFGFCILLYFLFDFIMNI